MPWPGITTRPSACSPTGRRRPCRVLLWARIMSWLSPRSAVRWTGCRWRSSWRPRGCGSLSVDQISARLDNRFALLTTGERSAAPRHRTLRATIEWSYDMLTAAERTLFAPAVGIRRVVPGDGRAGLRRRPGTGERHAPADRRAGRQVARGARAGGARPGPLPDAGLDQGIRGGAAGRRGGVGTVQARAARLHAADRGAPSGGRDGEGPGAVVGPGRLLPPVHRRRRQREPGPGVVPGRRRRGDRAADLHRGQPALDRVGYLRRGRRVAGFVPGPGTGRAGAADPGRRPGGTGAARGVQRSRRGRIPGEEGLALCREAARSSGPGRR